MYKKYYFLVTFFLLGYQVFSQSTIAGTVKDSQGVPLFGINVYIKSLNKGMVTDDKGNFRISNIPFGKYNVQVSSIGFKKQTITVLLQKGKKVFLRVEMQETNESLEEVVVKGKTKRQKKRENPIKIEVINVDKIIERATPVATIINQTSGVKVRQSAGVGSPTIVNINGLQENAIRFFKNGIPSNYLGRAFQIGVIPTNLISDIEIYKGVLPIELGADALGGAINIVTKSPDTEFLTASYEVGSFNTHTANITGNYLIPDSNFHVGFNSYYISSDNNYEFDAPVLDPNTQNFKKQKLPRFHDGLETYFIQGNFGIHDTKFADLLNFEASYFKFDKEIQTGISINVPIGEATFKEINKIASVTYEKIFTNNLELNFFMAYSKLNLQRKDVSNNKYNWFGEIISSDNFSSGETDGRKSDSDIDQDNFVSRLFSKYKISNNLNVKVSSTFTSQNRVGTDPFQEKNVATGIQPITIPSKYKKVISGIGVGFKLLDRKITNEFTFKHFYLNTESANLSAVPPTITKNVNKFGWGNSIKYKFNNTSYARISFENTTRIPEAEEYFGDNLFTLNNPGLNPEKSKNLNVGFSTSLNKNKTLFIDVNTFYRDTENFIRRLPVGFVFTRNENTNTQITKGIETTFKVDLNNGFKANTSITYQNMRRTDTKGSALEGSRTPNTPYFFTNVNVAKSYVEPFNLPILLDVYANYNFTEQYLLRPTPKILEPALFERDLGFTDLIIPEQHKIDFGVTVNFQKLPISINTEISNIANAKLFDEFRIQKPLRAFRLKITYKL
ncbi:TonB-dependent receptor [Polaribacter cellanae]|uniref:TonB-dependent receptor n=1 Tax=Polaribacter cellanae TaxID=2818493 RepID=A0A975CTP8_9FLAO|nr:TonB-dependent receptor [Polaribacter cellanae]QTE23922.1 TonB-dependent receptor [Polaribacter cellanae]